MGLLHDIGIVAGKNTKAGNLFETIFPNFMEIPYKTASEFMEKYWKTYKDYDKKHGLNGASNGEIFEYLLAVLFIREGLLPLYLQANVSFVPNVSFDLMLYTEQKGPICISAKTSLRERYKQADLEAMALKNVHRKSKSFLVTFDEKEAENLKRKIISGDVLGLNDVILADKPAFDQLIIELHGYTKIEAPEVKVVSASKIITSKKMDELKPKLL